MNYSQRNLNLRGPLPKIKQNTSLVLQNTLNSSHSLSNLNNSLRNLGLMQDSVTFPSQRVDFVTPKNRHRSRRFEEKNTLEINNSTKSFKAKEQPRLDFFNKIGYKILYTAERPNKKSPTCDKTTDDFLSVSKGEHIALRYEIYKTIGKGSFGKVFKAWDHKTEKFVALKILKKNPTVAMQSDVEIDILRKMKKSQFTINILSSFTYRNHVCIVFELLSKNLYEVIKRNKFRGLSLKFVKAVGFQVLSALKDIHSQSIIHCDIKPENIILKKLGKTDLKVIDFGSSCFSHKKIFTYIQSRFYRAPEIPLGVSYTTSIDIWSFACVLFELYTGHPLFHVETEFDLLSSIIQLLGNPPIHFIESGRRSHVFFENRIFKQPQNLKLRIPGTRIISDIIKSPLLADLVSACLVWNPFERPTAEELLKHPFFKQ